MKRIAAVILIAAVVLGAAYGSAAAIGLGGVDRLDGGSVGVTNLACGTGSGLVSGTVTCTTS